MQGPHKISRGTQLLLLLCHPRGMKNRTLIEVAGSMLNFENLPLYLWAEVVSIACFSQNQSIINRRLNMIPYEAMNGHKPSISFLHVFGCRYFIKNNRDQLTKFQLKADEAIFLYKPRAGIGAFDPLNPMRKLTLHF